MSNNPQLIKARDYAYRLLSYRPRSRQEIYQRLKQKKFSHPVITQTLTYLARLNYINDLEFARIWIRSKLNSSPCGRSLLRYSLRQKGVDENTADQALNELAGQYNQRALAAQLAQARCRQHRRLNPLQLKKRLYDYLRRRGFTQEIILEILKEKF